MTYRDLFVQIIKDMNDEELAEMIENNDLKNMAIFDNVLKGENDKDKIVELLRMQI